MKNNNKITVKIIIHKEEILHLSKHLADGFNKDNFGIKALGIIDKDIVVKEKNAKFIVTDAYSKEFVEELKELNSKIMFFASDVTDELIKDGVLNENEIIGSKTFSGEIYKLILDKYEAKVLDKKPSQYTFTVGGKVFN